MTPTRAEARAKVAAARELIDAVQEAYDTPDYEWDIQDTARDVLADLNRLDDMLQRHAPETPPGPSGGAR